MVRPERRTRADVVAAAAIAIVATVAGVVTWWTSDARATSSQSATEPVPAPTAARAVPQALTQLWTEASPATASPVVISGTVVTGDGRRVQGRDPVTGATRWSYARRSELCAVSWVYRYAVAVYPDSRGCGQVSAIDAVTGRRGPARTSYADPQVSVSADDNTVLAFGATRLELWRSDLVRVLSYGEIDARVKPSAQGVGHGCTLLSAAGGAAAVSVLEACPDQSDVRLTVLHPGKEEDEPDLRYLPQPGVGADAGARVLAVAAAGGDAIHTAVYLPAPQPRVEVIDQNGATVATMVLPQPPSPASAALTVSRPTGLVSWWTGDSVLVLDAATLAYRYTIPAVGSAVPLGPAATMAGRLLVPVRGGVGVYDAATGAFERTIPVSRPPGVDAVFPRVCGTTVLEQRGDTLAALG